VLGQGACPVAYLAGDLAAAARYTAMLLDHAERHPVRLWHLWARCFNGVVMAKQGAIASGLAILRGALEEAGEARSLPRFLLPLRELAANLGEAGLAAQGLALVEEALERCRTREEGWYVAELLRIKGELVIKENRPKAAPDAEKLLLSSLTARPPDQPGQRARHRLGPSPRCALVGIARRDEPRPNQAATGPGGAGEANSRTGLCAVYRGFRDRGPARRENPIGQIERQHQRDGGAT
jgi:hypothetical protein